MTPNYWLPDDDADDDGQQSHVSSSRAGVGIAIGIRDPLNNYEARNYFSMSGTPNAWGPPPPLSPSPSVFQACIPIAPFTFFPVQYVVQ